MRPRPRRYDPGEIRAALDTEWRRLVQLVDDLPDVAFGRPTGLGDWTVAQLVAHIAAGVQAMHRALARPAPPVRSVTLSDYLRSTAAWAEAVAARGRVLAQGRDTAQLRAELRSEVELAAAAYADALPGRLVAARLGALPLTDFAVTRLVEAVVHRVDLGRATGGSPDPHPAALAAVSRALADLLAVSAPGRSVELRVPPYVVVQCVSGLRHTRGTPPNVVETDPLTWIELATGRLSWPAALATGRVTASGSRADLARYLPVLR